MPLSGLLRRHRVALASSAVLAVAAGSLVAYALASRGYPVRHVELNDGGIWVTSDADGLYGRLNKPAQTLDAAFNPPGAQQADARLDIVQEGAAVAAWNASTGELFPVDVTTASATADRKASLPSDASISLAGGTLAVLDPASGKVWATHVDPSTSLTDLSAVDRSATPLADVGPPSSGGGAAAMTVGVDGTVHVVSTSGALVDLAPTATGFAKPVKSSTGLTATRPQITAVGGRAVVYDPATGRLALPGGKTATVQADPLGQLQTPTPGDTDVVVATSRLLLAVPIGGGAATTLFTTPTAAIGVARPTWLAPCMHAAWAGASGVYARSCDGAPAKRYDLGGVALQAPVFRVNRNAIALNDTQTGRVWDVTTQPRRVDDWAAVRPPTVQRDNDKNQNNNTSTSSHDRPPNAVPDLWGARPGRTTVLHVLDNDSDPQGYILSVVGVTAPDVPGVKLSIAPDGQTVEITMPDTSSDVHFGYTVDDGRGLSKTADVTVQARPVGQNKAPNLREGYTPTTWTVAAGGRLSIPTLADWRDFDGDPLFVENVTANTGTVSSTPDGRIDVVAPPAAATMTVKYDVSDGFDPSEVTSVPVTVLDPASTTTVPPLAQPDVARGQVGRPIVIRPLDNDLPGADPTNPDAVLTLAGEVAQPSGASVVTDVKTGTITLTPQRAGSFPLTYTAAYGNAKFASGAIRVDVTAPPPTPAPLIAMPDTGVLYGQNPAIVDVLANDFDPSGAVMVVQHAAPVDASVPVQVAILSGRFLRVTASSPIPASTPVVIRYTIADGLAPTADGEVALTAQAPPAADVPVTRDDVATVRAGDSVTIPVLDNDSTPAGSPISLQQVVPVKGLPAGQLRTTTVNGDTGNIGAAYVSGNLVRYVPPAAVTAPTTALVDYVAVNPEGEQATGHIRITVNPDVSPTNPDNPPAPQALEARVVAGDTVHINVPTSGVDPDGDSVAVTGITVPDGAAAPTLGRITKISATTIDYQAFPSATSGGTDTLTYQVSDRYGKVGSASVRVAVVQPGDPQPPVAVDDVVTAAPGSSLVVDVLANDLRSPDDTVSIAPLTDTNPELAGGVDLSSPQGPITLKSPAADGKPLVVLYSITNGLGIPSVGKLTVRSVAGYNNPPIAVDAYATPSAQASTVTVDVLSRDDDVDGDASRLKLTTFGNPNATVSGGGKVTVKIGTSPQTIPYLIEDSGGAFASAVIHVPAAGQGAPYVKDGQLIRIDKAASATFDVNDYVVDPAGKKLSLTLKNRVWAAPSAGLQATTVDGTHLKVTGQGDYIGPAAITFEVTDGATVDDPNGVLGVVTIPVQVGPETPVLRCPGTSLAVVEGGQDLGLDVTSLCHVWVADPATIPDLLYQVDWVKDPGGVEIIGNGTHRPSIRAGGNATSGSGTLKVTVKDTSALPATISVDVTAAPRPTVAPITVDGFKATDTATFDLAGYVRSPLRDKVVTVVSVTRTDGDPAEASATGSTVTIKPGADSHGTIGFAVVVSDVADTSRTDRQVTGRIVLNVLNVPDAPGTPVPNRSVISHVVQLSWSAPAANGAPIDYYTVSGGNGAQRCAASPCAITGLTNGTAYSFTVTAHNLVGDSKPSAASTTATPDAVPGAVPGFVAEAVGGDASTTSSVQLSWGTPANDGSALTGFQVFTPNGAPRTVGPGERSLLVPGLTNGSSYSFQIRAGNKGPGTWGPTTTSGAAVPYGTPFALGKPTAANADAAAPTSDQVVTVSVDVPSTEGNGRDVTAVTFVQSPGGATRTTKGGGTAAFKVPNDGTQYTYTATATNAEGKTSAASPPSDPYRASGSPAKPGAPSASAPRADYSIDVTWAPAAVNGARIDHVVFTLSGSDGSHDARRVDGQPASPYTLGSLAAGTSYTVTVTVCNEANCGAPSDPSNAVTAYGPVQDPHASISHGDCSGHDGNSTFTYGWSGGSGNGRSVSYFVKVDGGDWTQHGTPPNGGSNTFTAGCGGGGAQHTVKVVLRFDNGTDASNTATDTAGEPDNPPPPRSISVSKGAYSKNYAGCSQGCHKVHVNMNGFNAGTTYSCTIHASAHDYTGGSQNVSIRGDQNGDIERWFGYVATVTVTCDGVSGSEGGNWGTP